MRTYFIPAHVLCCEHRCKDGLGREHEETPVGDVDGPLGGRAVQSDAGNQSGHQQPRQQPPVHQEGRGKGCVILGTGVYLMPLVTNKKSKVLVTKVYL